MFQSLARFAMFAFGFHVMREILSYKLTWTALGILAGMLIEHSNPGTTGQAIAWGQHKVFGVVSGAYNAAFPVRTPEDGVAYRVE